MSFNNFTTTWRQYGRDDVDYVTWYTPWSKQYALIHTRAEIEKMLGMQTKRLHSASESHCNAVAATTSMTGQSQRRAHTRNTTALSSDMILALRAALEIYDLFPEHTKEGA